MPKQSYAKRMEGELTPVVDGRQYRAREVKIIDDRCTGCAASNGGVLPLTDLCNKLPECTKSKRLDAKNVVFVDCGLCAKQPEVKNVYNAKGGVRYEHEAFKAGTRWVHKPTACLVEVVDEGMAGMPEVKFEDGHTIYAFPQDLIKTKEGGAE